MTPREELNALICSRGIDGSIEVGSEKFFTETSQSISKFQEEYPNNNIFVFSDDYPLKTTLVAGSFITDLIGSITFFHNINFVSELVRNDLKTVSKTFIEMFVFGCLYHEMYHCREGGKYLKDLQTRKVIPEHDSDPEEIQADLYAIRMLNHLLSCSKQTAD